MLRFDRLDRLGGFNRFHSSLYGQLRAQTKHRAGFTLRALVCGRLVMDALTPTCPSDPDRYLVERAVCHGQHLSVAVNAQPAAEGVDLLGHAFYCSQAGSTRKEMRRFLL